MEFIARRWKVKDFCGNVISDNRDDENLATLPNQPSILGYRLKFAHDLDLPHGNQQGTKAKQLSTFLIEDKKVFASRPSWLFTYCENIEC